MTTKIGVFIGRFNPPHLGHLSVIEEALSNNDKLIIVIGSHKTTFSPRKLLSTEQVQNIILAGVSDPSRIEFASVRDNLYSDNEWVIDVRKQINYICSKIYDENKIISLYGFSKDQTSQYLKWFPFYHTIEALPFVNGGGELLHASDIRELIYKNSKSLDINIPYGNLPVSGLELTMGKPMATQFITELLSDNLERVLWISDEYWHYKSYKDAWSKAPYAPTFVTGDAVVFCNGCVLLIKRKFSPGKGCYALPGGFINQNETVKACILRELAEETKIDVPPAKLANSLKEIVLFDAPSRSMRGRTITNAGLIVLEETKIPKVKASDDAMGAIWMPLDMISRLEDKFFEDHFYIIMKLSVMLG